MLTKSFLDKATFWIFVSIWPLWFIWEMVILGLRLAGIANLPSTISMVARDRGWHVNSVVYVWMGLGSHYWWPSTEWAGTVGSILFWVIVLALLIQDCYLWNTSVVDWPLWLKYQRWPLVWGVFGVFAGRFLFPQAGLFPWSKW